MENYQQLLNMTKPNQQPKPSDSIFYAIKNSQQKVGIGSTQFSLETLFRLKQL